MVEVEMEMEKEKDPLDTKEYIVLEEDPEMYAMAGIELVPVPAPVHVQESQQSGRPCLLCLL